MLTDSKSGYGLVSIVLHWLGAVAIVGVWWLGDRIDDVPRADKALAQSLHFGVAILALGVIVPRLVWRFRHLATPMAETGSVWLDRIARLVKWGLLTTMTLLIVTGPLAVWTSRRGAIDVFGLVLPSPIPDAVKSMVHTVAQPVHVISAKLILILVALHVLGALKHLVIDRDGVFRRMLVPAR